MNPQPSKNPPPKADEPPHEETPPALSMGERAVLAFRRDLPRLLQELPSRVWWVAYYGDAQVGRSKSPAELYRRCFQLGMKQGDFIVRPIAPEPPREFMHPYAGA
jgi:hypothetical protein